MFNLLILSICINLIAGSLEVSSTARIGGISTCLEIESRNRVCRWSGSGRHNEIPQRSWLQERWGIGSTGSVTATQNEVVVSSARSEQLADFQQPRRRSRDFGIAAVQPFQGAHDDGGSPCG